MVGSESNLLMFPLYIYTVILYYLQDDSISEGQQTKGPLR